MTKDNLPQDGEPLSPEENGDKDENVSKNLSKKILQNITKSYTGEETSKFIVDLGETLQSAPSEEPVPQSADDRQLRSPAPSLLDKLFDDFTRYSFEFARTHIGSELSVECVSPRPLRDPAQLPPGETPVIVEGVLMVGDWSMLVQAQERRIRAYVIPREYVTGFHGRQSFYSPYLEMEAVFEGAQVLWELDGIRLDTEVLSKLSKQLFGAFVKVSVGEASHNERFRLESSISRSIGGLLPRKDEKLALHDLPSLGAISLDGQKHSSIEIARKGFEPDAAEELQANKVAVLSMFETLIRSLDGELSRLQRIEREACRVADMKIVEQTSMRTNQLKSLLDRITGLAGDWRTISSTDRRSEN